MRFYVLGTGDSIHKYKPTPGSYCVGVNDIWKFIQTDFLVCMDLPGDFKPERLKIITDSMPIEFFTLSSEMPNDDPFKQWDKHFPRIKHLKQAKPRGNLDAIDDPESIPVSICSPFCACVIAYRLGATEIILYGVDLINHWLLSTKDNQDRLIKDFKGLRESLFDRGCNLYVGTDKTALHPTIPVHEEPTQQG